jgi:hypothetical protein
MAFLENEKDKRIPIGYTGPGAFAILLVMIGITVISNNLSPLNFLGIIIGSILISLGILLYHKVKKFLYGDV